MHSTQRTENGGSRCANPNSGGLEQLVTNWDEGRKWQKYKTLQDDNSFFFFNDINLYFFPPANNLPPEGLRLKAVMIKILTHFLRCACWNSKARQKFGDTGLEESSASLVTSTWTLRSELSEQSFPRPCRWTRVTEVLKTRPMLIGLESSARE